MSGRLRSTSTTSGHSVLASSSAARPEDAAQQSRPRISTRLRMISAVSGSSSTTRHDPMSGICLTAAQMTTGVSHTCASSALFVCSSAYVPLRSHLPSNARVLTVEIDDKPGIRGWMRKDETTDADEPRALDDADAHAAERLVVVGIGASAGGLETLGELVQQAPLDHMAFIVVQHLAPNYESLLPQLLARSTKLTVVSAADGMVLERDHVYVSPPNANLALLHGTLRVITPPDTHGVRLPIDYLFRSLADDQGPLAI